MSPGGTQAACPDLLCLLFLSLSFFHLKMGQKSQVVGPGLPSSLATPPPFPGSGCRLASTVGEGTPQSGGDVTGVSSLWARGSPVPTFPQPLA